ncbi:MAG: PhzF family phenazine biosynthesis protein [Anaerohalosphaeraceae bacterium]|jgi:PhzF family phenazine biosynthesis protein
MKTQVLYQVDAFASELFSGNPAGVCILEKWLPDNIMQSVAAENNLAETAFAVPTAHGYEIRWFTPETEVALCGHATLATAHVLFNTRHPALNSIRFQSRERGILEVAKSDGWLVLNFPSDTLEEVEMPKGLAGALGGTPKACWKGLTDYMVVYETEEEIRTLSPNYHLLNQIPVRGVIVTSPGRDHDFVSRFFAPRCGVPEDPVTGSAHTTLIPYWGGKLGKTRLSAAQLSSRGGILRCELLGDRVKIAGKAITYMKAELYLP